MNFMQSAINEALNSENDICVGAVIVKNDEIISSCHNKKELFNDSTAHAEILSISEASKKLGSWRLDDCDIYITLEPCPMCAWAIMQARIKNIYFGSYDHKYGGFSKAGLDKISDYKPKIYGGIMESECDKILKNYFSKIRK